MKIKEKVSRSLAGVAILALAGCGHDSKGPEKKAEGPRAAPVTVATAALSTTEATATYEATGTVRATASAVISSKVMGYVREVHVQLGDRVRKDQPLATLDSRDLDAVRQRADAGVMEAQAAMPEVRNSIAAAKANADLAETTFRRIKELFEKKSVSNQEYDEASARLKAAQAALDMARAKEPQVNAKMAQAEAGRLSTQVMQEYARITAPFAGVVSAKQMEPGQLATPGAPLLTIEREGAYRLEASVDESRSALVRVGQAVSVTLDALGKTVQAKVSEVVPVVDAASRSYMVKIDLPSMPLLRSGLYGRATFGAGSRSMQTIPAAAVMRNGQLQSVLVPVNGVARMRIVTTGQASGGRVEVLSGIEAGERVVSPIPAGLKDGDAVVVSQ